MAEIAKSIERGVSIAQMLKQQEVLESQIESNNLATEIKFGKMSADEIGSILITDDPKLRTHRIDAFEKRMLRLGRPISEATKSMLNSKDMIPQLQVALTELQGGDSFQQAQGFATLTQILGNERSDEIFLKIIGDRAAEQRALITGGAAERRFQTSQQFREKALDLKQTQRKEDITRAEGERKEVTIRTIRNDISKITSVVGKDQERADALLNTLRANKSGNQQALQLAVDQFARLTQDRLTEGDILRVERGALSFVQRQLRRVQKFTVGDILSAPQLKDMEQLALGLKSLGEEIRVAKLTPVFESVQRQRLPLNELFEPDDIKRLGGAQAVQKPARPAARGNVPRTPQTRDAAFNALVNGISRGFTVEKINKAMQNRGMSPATRAEIQRAQKHLQQQNRSPQSVQEPDLRIPSLGGR